MQVLILSCSTGEGHNACAKAIAEVFTANGDVCNIRDALSFISDRSSRLFSRGHVNLYRWAPRLFGFGYDYAERHPALFEKKSCFYRYLSKGTEPLYRLIVEHPYDTVICTHLFAALMLSEVQRQHHLPIKTAFVATDYTCYPGIQGSVLDEYFIPDAHLRKSFVAAGIPEERIMVSGIPIRQMFYNRTASADAKKAIGIPADQLHLVMACGSMGCGPIRSLTDRLTKHWPQDFCLTVICGSNERRRLQLERRFAQRENLQILGYVQDMSGMLDGCDLYITKPGGISVSEAAEKNVPMVFIEAVAGCEAYNRRFFMELGAAVAGRTPRETVRHCLSLLSDASGRDVMTGKLSARTKHNAAECIYRTMQRAHSASQTKGGFHENTGTGN